LYSGGFKVHEIYGWQTKCVEVAGGAEGGSHDFLLISIGFS
jgi:hypothetical protein